MTYILKMPFVPVIYIVIIQLQVATFGSQGDSESNLLSMHFQFLGYLSNFTDKNVIQTSIITKENNEDIVCMSDCLRNMQCMEIVICYEGNQTVCMLISENTTHNATVENGKCQRFHKVAGCQEFAYNSHLGNCVYNEGTSDLPDSTEYSTDATVNNNTTSVLPDLWTGVSPFSPVLTSLILDEETTSAAAQSSPLPPPSSNLCDTAPGSSLSQILLPSDPCIGCDCTLEGYEDCEVTVDGKQIEGVCMCKNGKWWFVIHRLRQGTVDFNRSWYDYKVGFGSFTSDFWIGNDVIHLLTSKGYNKLWIHLFDEEGDVAYAQYKFYIEDEANDYKIHISCYSGDAGDAFNVCSQAKWCTNGMAFTTFDRDNDNRASGNCARDYSGGWWYNDCFYVKLTGKYGVDSYPGIIWYPWRQTSCLKKTRMMIQ